MTQQWTVAMFPADWPKLRAAHSEIFLLRAVCARMRIRRRRSARVQHEISTGRSSARRRRRRRWHTSRTSSRGWVLHLEERNTAAQDIDDPEHRRILRLPRSVLFTSASVRSIPIFRRVEEMMKNRWASLLRPKCSNAFIYANHETGAHARDICGVVRDPGAASGLIGADALNVCLKNCREPHGALGQVELLPSNQVRWRLRRDGLIRGRSEISNKAEKYQPELCRRCSRRIRMPRAFAITSAYLDGGFLRLLCEQGRPDGDAGSQYRSLAPLSDALD